MNQAKKTTVLLTDDHAVVRMGLAAIINLESDLAVCGEAEDGATAARLAGELRPDVIVMDFRMPGMDGALDSFNLENLRSQESNKIYHSIRTFIVEGPFLDGKRLNLDSEEETDDFIRSLETAQHTRIQKLRQMSDALVINPELIVPSMAVPPMQAMREELRGVYGADELRELMGIATLGDETLTCDLMIARYGDRWYAVSAGGPAFSYLAVSRESHAFVSTHGSIINR